MKKYIPATGCFLLLTAFIANNPTGKNNFQKLYALEGRWLMKTAKGFIGEEWQKVNADYLQSHGFFINGKDTVITERIALRNTSDGIFYVSTVENQNNRQPVAFKLSAETENRFVFENAKHDFPRRIVYEFISPDSLHAYIDGGPKAPNKREDFYYRKVK